jgi:hypothetical protein
LRVEDYFQYIRGIIDSSPYVHLSNVTCQKRGSYEGFIRGELYFVDGSQLHIREFVDVEIETERLMYAYQYMDSSDRLIFRYDNTPHHKKLDLPTYPHHKHQDSEENVVSSAAPDLTRILEEIQTHIQLP